MSPGRWQLWQFSCSTGSTSRWKVTAPDGAAGAAKAFRRRELEAKPSRTAREATPVSLAGSRGLFTDRTSLWIAGRETRGRSVAEGTQLLRPPEGAGKLLPYS